MLLKRLPVLLMTWVVTAVLVSVGATSTVSVRSVPVTSVPVTSLVGQRPAGAVTPARPAVVTAPARPAAAAQAPGTPCAATARACIDLTHNQAWLISAGTVEYGPVPITSGRKGYRTPVGTFHVLYRQRLHLSRQFDNAPMPYSVFFIPGIAFHQGSLGVPSHGCIHLSRASAMRFFAELRVGDMVQAVR